MTTCAVIILAAGAGQRFGGSLPKQYYKIGDKCILNYTFEKFIDSKFIDYIQPVINKNDNEIYDKKVSQNVKDKLLKPIYGGKRRQDSVRFALEKLKVQNPTWVLIHDAVRPLVSTKLINNIVQKLNEEKIGIIPILPIFDSIKKIDKLNNKQISVPRENLFTVQTPQGFDYKQITKLQNKYIKNNVTDDASLYELENIPLSFIDGDKDNIKITTKEDFLMVSDIMLETKTGIGFDVHKFTSGNEITLGGIKIPFHKSLEGHSDADVILHSITDSLLGALGENDIGYHFPDTDIKNLNKESKLFLMNANNKLKERNGKIIHSDINIICEEPKISPYRNKIVESISNILKINKTRINIKATTTEGLGFTGRKEGIACQAVTTIKIPNN